MLLRMSATCVLAVLSGVGRMTMSRIGVVRGFLMIARFIMFSGFRVVLRSICVMFGSLLVMFSGGF